VNRPYVVKLGDHWTYGCWACGMRRDWPLSWHGAVAGALWHAQISHG
jgi:hypothetical protein